ncbi:MarR family winged helix-turn-helix transcriptional regulator [Cytobacillus sp. IB215665]|uniref:MarR family winged helix-turn-helix transcriptional regulator n=1 Tax=Cytobacillus sp. IB215665 TaxID=3097357 RepID=UPI002A0C8411|nr:MarR family transcriptional regulator [Cytobacillus sp. IB215665]MDX8367317.1 MarR family transcriptional regulator [Cytobacillus sp. IB215665]
MDDITAIYYKKLKHSSDALNTIFLEEYHGFANKEFLNLTTKQSILLELLNANSLTNNEISNHFSITPSAATQLVSKLEKKGFLKREINVNNRREIIVHLDEKGKEYNQIMANFELYIIQKYYSKLNENDLENLVDLQQKLYNIATEIQQKEKK